LNPPKCDDLDYIHFLTASVGVFTCTEAARCQPEGDNSPSHDAFTRLLQRQPPDTEALWDEVKGIIQLQKGYVFSSINRPLDAVFADHLDITVLEAKSIACSLCDRS
jgi:hypothetical protein